ncbi:acyl-CoA thioesterase II [Pseudonocardia ailaonensis]|uniref:Acyl-CoA thioesterase II n=1 Tax=Pseudonocardia ailaonensis TaxID=367279 RepID=A0ABN2MZ00_9PSEU
MTLSSTGTATAPPTPADLLAVRREEPGRFTAAVHPVGGQVAFGGQLVAHTVSAAAAELAGRPVRQVHTVFARSGRTDRPVDIAVEVIHSGRSLSSAEVAVTQGDRALCRSLVLADEGDEDLIAAAETMPAVPGPESLPDIGWDGNLAAARFADPGYRPAERGPDGEAELAVWTRWPDLADDPAGHAAALAWHTEPFVMNAALRPHDGVAVSMAHAELDTAVLTHTVTFHAPARADEWHLVWQRGLHAGAGRVHGRGEVFTADGRHVASFVQEAMVRANQLSREGGRS